MDVVMGLESLHSEENLSFLAWGEVMLCFLGPIARGDLMWVRSSPYYHFLIE